MKRIIFFSIIIASLFIINTLVHSITTLWQKHDLLVNSQRELERQKKENQYLTQQLSIAQSPEFVEQTARNKLFLVKPGEKRVLINEALLKTASDSAKASAKGENKPNFQQWLELFF